REVWKIVRPRPALNLERGIQSGPVGRVHRGDAISTDVNTHTRQRAPTPPKITTGFQRSPSERSEGRGGVWTDATRRRSRARRGGKTSPKAARAERAQKNGREDARTTPPALRSRAFREMSVASRRSVLPHGASCKPKSRTVNTLDE